MDKKTVCAGLGLLLLLGAFCVFPLGGAAETEPNDSFATAQAIEPGTHSGQLNTAGGPDDEYDYYKFAVAEGQRFSINGSAGAGSEVRFHVGDPGQDEILTSGWLVTDGFEVLEYTLGHANAGNYYVWSEISGADVWANYTFTLEVIDQADAGQAGDAGDTDSTARTITPGTYEGWLDDEDQDDYYTFEVPDGNKLVLEFMTADTNPMGGSMRLEVYRPDKDSLNETDWANPGVGHSLLHQTSDTTGGMYFAKMTYTGDGGDYTLTLALEPEDDAGSGTDVAGDINTDPYMLPGNGTYSGYMLDDDGADFYKFNVSAGQIITYNLTNGMAEPESIRFNMYRPDKDQYQSSDWLNPGIGQELAWITNNDGAGTWYLMAEGANSYTFDLLLVDQMDADVLGDAGDAIDTARPVQADEHYTGLLGDDDEVDHYSFEGTAGSTVIINFSFYSGSDTGRVHLYGPDKNGITNSDWVNPEVPTNITQALAATGTHYIQVETGNMEYMFNLSLVAPPVGDTESPVVAVTSPATGTTVNTTTVNLTGTASDNVGVAKVEVSLDGAIWTAATGTTSWTYLNLTLAQGSNTVRVRATDAAGNNNTTSIAVTYQPPAPPDTEKPVVSILVPASGSKTSKSKLPVISGTATDNVDVTGVELKVNGATVPNTFLLGAWMATNVSLKEGKNTIEVTATDAAGNTGTQTITVTYEKPAPSPGFEGLLLVVAVLAGLLLLARRKRN